MNFLAFQRFQPRERAASDRCIWCGAVAEKNRAHVISRKLTVGADNAPTLRFSVCASCNSTCGKLEEWILRATPLSWLRMMLYAKSGSSGTTRHVPSYYFSARLQEWIVFHLDARTRAFATTTQLLHPFGTKPMLLTDAPPPAHAEIISALSDAIRSKNYLTDVRPSLPDGFSPRLLLDGTKVIWLAPPVNGPVNTPGEVLDLEKHEAKLYLEPLGNTGQHVMHFRWSKVNWARFCAKAALETLCLCEGAEVCLRPAYERARDFVVHGALQPGREIVFDERGPAGDINVPTSPRVDLTVSQDAPTAIAAFLPECAIGMHAVALYEIRGWILASVVFAGLPATVLVLAGPDEHLSDFYQLIYDDQESKFDFVCLAYDPARPIIPLSFVGEAFDELVATYGLNSRGV
jgi:hypothetical protein